MEEIKTALARISPKGLPESELETVRSLLQSYEKFLYWGREEKALEIRVKLNHCNWLPAEILDTCERRGAAKRKEIETFILVLRKSETGSQNVKDEYARITKLFPDLTHDLLQEQKHQARIRQRIDLEKQKKEAGLPSSTVKATGEHRFQNLYPAPSWNLLIDETGDRFDGRSVGLTGKFVGVLVPDGIKLPALPADFHSAEVVDSIEIDAALQSLLENSVGIFGITVDDLPPSLGERWVDGVMELIHWTWRLLPLAANSTPTHLDVLIEQRGEFGPDYSWQAVRRELLRQWAAIDPSRANAIAINIKTVAKNSHPFFGYVDAVAYTWGSKAAPSQARLAQSGLVGKCLNAGNGKTLRRLWDALNRQSQIGAEEWRWLVNLPESSDPESIAGSLSKRIGLSTHAKASLWHIYLEAVQKHLESKAVSIGALGKECDWLHTFQPPEAFLPATLQLAWKTSLLAKRNHLGHTVLLNLEQEIETLSSKLLDEDSRLVCLSDLHRAVLATNRFDFAAAEQCLARWKNKPTAAAGLQMVGRVHSSLGQHLAFQGRLTEARVEFSTALECFYRMSDPAVVMGEKSQTETYLAIATMDDATIPTIDVTAAIERVTGKLEQAIPAIACGNHDSDKYRHHLLLRYLTARGSEEHKRSYLSRWEKWLSAEGHPWPLIAFYRGVLISTQSSAAAEKCFAHGCRLAFAADQGPLVNLIGLTIQIAGRVGGQGWEATAESMLIELEKQLPKASERLRILQKAIYEPMPPLEIAKKVLPFNFR